jgi:membrane-bound lytic murein transglycosylase B
MRIGIVLLIALLLAPSAAKAQPFEAWLSSVRVEAQEKGISQPVIDSALSGLTPNQKVIDLDRKQPEKKISFRTYRQNVVNSVRIEKGREMMRRHASLLRAVESKYGVAPQYVVALWAIETNFGDNTGGFDIVRSLATLAWEGRRASFFKDELFKALKIIDKGHISRAAMKGSWAGAMGQNQFMPSSFWSYAQDYNEDGRKDIWNTLPDVFASTANYLAESGWNMGDRWGREVHVPQGFSKEFVGLETHYTLGDWKKMGVTLPDRSALRGDNAMKAWLVAPDGLSGATYLVYENYKTIMKWNRSTYFATSVGLLADAMAE